MESQRQPGALPPEVEAELRRRAAETAAYAPPPPALDEFALPSGAPPSAEPQEEPGWKKALKALGPIGAVLLLLGGKLKYLALIGKFALPALKTGGTMLISIWVYAQMWGASFAVGFVLSILVHEMGHVFAAWRLGIPVSAPLFIPGFGAIILQKQAAKSTWDEALIGIGGPIGGTIAGLISLALFWVTGNPLFKAIAYTGFFLNLFNLIPVFPLDGGWITGAISPRIWLVGTVAMIVGFVMGWIRNPLIFILILLSLPRLWKGLRTGKIEEHGQVPVTSTQRITMGVAYVSLAALLLWLMTETYIKV